MVTSISFEKPKRRMPKAHFRRRDWLALMGSAIIAGGFSFFHPSIFSAEHAYLPGIGLTLSCWAILAICFGFIGWRKLKWSAEGAFLLASAVLLSACYGIFANGRLRMMNLAPVVILSVLSVYSLKTGGRVLNPEGIRSAAMRVLISLRRHIPLPVYAVLELRSGKNSKAIAGIALGVGICIPLVGFVLLMLCDADAVFGGVVGSIFSRFGSPGLGITVWNCARMLILTLMIFAFIFGLRHCQPEAGARRSFAGLPVVTVSVMMAALSAVYTVFVYVQCRYLFAGEARWMADGSYAEYARQGFFQLVAVSIVTLMVVLPPLCLRPESRAVRVLGGYVTLLTMVIVFSALWRMNLYISAYGLSFLRVLTLWGIFAIFAAMIGALVKAIRPGKRIFAALMVVLVISWLGFNFANVDLRIAGHNIDRYVNGELSEIDMYYLYCQLSRDARPAIDEFVATDRGDTVMRKLEEYEKSLIRDMNSGRPGWYDWSLAWKK